MPLRPVTSVVMPVSSQTLAADSLGDRFPDLLRASRQRPIGRCRSARSARTSSWAVADDGQRRPPRWHWPSVRFGSP